jgi:hypothetical protein
VVNGRKGTVPEPDLENPYSTTRSRNNLQRVRRVLGVGNFLLAKDLSVLVTGKVLNTWYLGMI